MLSNYIIFIFLFTLNVSLATYSNLRTPPIPLDNPQMKEKIKLGKMLYFDKRLSADNTVSCQTCHNVHGSGTDNLQFSVGIHGLKGGRNAPTVWNSALLSVQFWDGRSPSLEEQSKGPIINPVEMGMADHDTVVKKLRGIKGYEKIFEKVFGKNAKGSTEQNPSSIDIERVAMSIASFERTLISEPSPFENYLAGDKKAISEKAERGWKLVSTIGCVGCHNGITFDGIPPNLGEGYYQLFPRFKDNEYVKKYKLDEDPGRFGVTKNPKDTSKFRVPTWRNVAETAPYFHNGSVDKLDEAVRVMAKVQLRKVLKDSEVEEIVEFLKSLTGKKPKIVDPILPN